MKDFEKLYYEQPCFWDKDYLQNPIEKERINKILNEIISLDTHSVLDVGCGNGAFVNTLIRTFPDRFDRVVGMDTSEEALKYVRTERLKGTVSKIPFEDKSFDLVTCLEVLEHLPYEEYKKGLQELQRLSSRYILITVPNSEYPESGLVICPECRCYYNPYFHLKCFNIQKLEHLFQYFELEFLNEIGPCVYRYLPNYMKVRRIFREETLPPTAICPQCGYKEKVEDGQLVNKPAPKKKSILSKVKGVERFLFAKKKKRWLIGRYERKP